MSTGPRFQRCLAIQALGLLQEGYRLTLQRVAGFTAAQDLPLVLHVVGSVRRELDEVGDLELIAPLPGEGEPDVLLLVLDQLFPPDQDRQLDIFSPKQHCIIGRRRSRFAHGARQIKMQIDLDGMEAIPVEIYRYHTGEPSNRGWIELLRTGPAEFGQRLLGDYKRRRGNHTDDLALPGSRDGFLVDGDGRPIHTPDEQSVFDLVGWPYTPPEARA